jgi:16S rRNA (guanine527-N7)-methyltransferase
MRSVEDVEAVQRADTALGIRLERSQVESLIEYAQLLRDRAVPLGMVSRNDSNRILERHVLDCLRAAPVIRELGAGGVLDLGSGAGLPGVVLAVALPEVRFVLAEARTIRAAFLELVAERLGLANARVHAGRADEVMARFDASTARAFAPMEEAWRIARARLEPGGALVFFAGASERLPTQLPGAASISRRPAPSGTSGRESLASGGDLVIITAS